MSFGEGLMNKLVLIFAFLNFLIIFSNLLRWFFIFKISLNFRISFDFFYFFLIIKGLFEANNA